MFALSIKRKERREIIDVVAKINIGAGIALAAADYEWTLNRCILVLGKSPTITLRDKLCNYNTKNDKLKEIWKEEINNSSLPAIFENNDKNIKWQDLKFARDYRNLLMHGIECNIEDEIGLAVIYIYESACEILYHFALSQDKDIYDRLRPRQRKGAEIKISDRTSQRKYEVQKALKDYCKKHSVSDTAVFHL